MSAFDNVCEAISNFVTPTFGDSQSVIFTRRIGGTYNPVTRQTTGAVTATIPVTGDVLVEADSAIDSVGGRTKFERVTINVNVADFAAWLDAQGAAVAVREPLPGDVATVRGKDYEVAAVKPEVQNLMRRVTGKRELQ